MSAARIADIGIVSCRLCGRTVGMLRAEVPLTPTVAAALHWSEERRDCACPATRLPRTAALPASVRARLERLTEASAGALPWEQLTGPALLRLTV